MSRVRLRNSVLIAAIGFILGWVVTRPIFVAWTDAFSIRAVAAPSLNQTNAVAYSSFVVLWVDNWAKSQPLVEAVWMVGIPVDYSSVDLTALPPRPFQASLSRGAEGLPLEMLQTHLRGPFGGTIIFDRKDIRMVVDLIGGIDIGGHRMNGADVEQYLLTAPDESSADRLIRQAAVMQGLLAQMALSRTEVRLADLIDIPKSSADRSVLVEVVRHYYPLRLQSVHVRVENPEAASNSP